MPTESAGVLHLPATLAPYAAKDSEFTEALMKAMMEPIAAGSASSLLPYIVYGEPASSPVWDEFVNGG